MPRRPSCGSGTPSASRGGRARPPSRPRSGRSRYRPRATATSTRRRSASAGATRSRSRACRRSPGRRLRRLAARAAAVRRRRRPTRAPRRRSSDRSAGPASAQQVEGLREHGLGRLQRGHVGLVRAGGGDQVDHLGHRVHVRHEHVALRVRVGMARVVHPASGCRVGHDPHGLHAAGRLAGTGTGQTAGGARELGGEAVRLRRLQHHLAALVRAAVRAASRLRVGEVLRRHVHAQALGAEAARGDVYRVEEAHQATPIAVWMIWTRALATLTRASYSRPFLAIRADSVSTSTPLPSARIVCGSCCGVKLVASIVAPSLVLMAWASAPWKSRSIRWKPGVSAFARLLASTLWRIEAPEMARSKASWVLSIRVTGGSAEGTEGVLLGLRCGHRPWWLPPVSARWARALAPTRPRAFALSPRDPRAECAAWAPQIGRA